MIEERSHFAVISSHNGQPMDAPAPGTPPLGKQEVGSPNPIRKFSRAVGMIARKDSKPDQPKKGSWEVGHNVPQLYVHSMFL